VIIQGRTAAGGSTQLNELNKTQLSAPFDIFTRDLGPSSFLARL